MFTRFTRTYIALLVALIVIVSLVTMSTHHPLQSYIDPWTGKVFGEGGVEDTFSNAHKSNEVLDVQGGVIMPTLGNATAKCVGKNLALNVFIHLI